MAVAKKKPNKNPVVKPMPVPPGRGSAGRQPEWKGGVSGPQALAKMQGAPSMPQARNLTPPNATGIKKQAPKKGSLQRVNKVYW
jgi:hypothetical protein